MKIRVDLNNAKSYNKSFKVFRTKTGLGKVTIHKLQYKEANKTDLLLLQKNYIWKILKFFQGLEEVPDVTLNEASAALNEMKYNKSPKKFSNVPETRKKEVQQS